MTGEIFALILILIVIGMAYVSETNENGSIFKDDSNWFKKWVPRKAVLIKVLLFVFKRMIIVVLNNVEKFGIIYTNSYLKLSYTYFLYSIRR